MDFFDYKIMSFKNILITPVYVVTKDDAASA